MNYSLQESLDSIRTSLLPFLPELLIIGAIIFLLLLGLFRKNNAVVLHGAAFISLLIVLITIISSFDSLAQPESLFSGMLRRTPLADYLKIIFALSGLVTITMSFRRPAENKLSEYYALILSIILGANLLVMSDNLLMVFLSLEVLSISSYILTVFAFNKAGIEGSLKYFVFGSVASATMLYGFSLLYGLCGTLSFTTIEFVQNAGNADEKLLLFATLFSLAGFLYKVAAAPMHPWAPDVYEAAPVPVVALFSVVPKLAGVGILAKFFWVFNVVDQAFLDIQVIAAFIILITLLAGNFSALWQTNVKRLMAYSSIAQSGFLLVALLSFSERGIHFFLFYATVYAMLNFLVFIYVEHFDRNGFTTIASYAGSGKTLIWPSLFLLVGMIGLVGLPPTAGFTGKLFIFSALWDNYVTSGKSILLWVLVFGLLNTAVSLFYYLRIPFYAFIRPAGTAFPANNLTLTNLLGLILVLLVLVLFFGPGLLMGWINKINFAF